jgi:hypothetical protein
MRQKIIPFFYVRSLLRLEENIRKSKKYTTLLRNYLLQFVYCQEKKIQEIPLKKKDSKLNFRF